MTDTTETTPTPETVAKDLGLHILMVEQILAGATSGLESAVPRQGNRDDRDLLLANYAIAERLLKAAGFERFCGAVAGIDSGSSWMNNATGEIVHVNVRDWNLITAPEPCPETFGEEPSEEVFAAALRDEDEADEREAGCTHDADGGDCTYCQEGA